MTGELDVLKFVCHSLDLANIPYMLTGSFAANFYAVPRMTRDIDIVVQVLESDIDKIFNTFQNDFYVNAASIAEAIKYQGMFNIIHYASTFKVDFIVRKNSAYRCEEFQRRHRVQLDHVPVWIVSPEDLIISKLFWAKDSLSTMQLNDVKNLLIALKNLDQEYMQKWIQMLKLENVYEKASIYE